jgi:putative redox protein
MENTISWVGDLGFKCKNRNHEIILDVDQASGSLDRGPTPKEALLSSAASCSAMDIIAILKKMRDLPTEFEVEIDCRKREEKDCDFSLSYSGVIDH